MEQLLKILEKNARLDDKAIAVMLDTTEAAVAAEIEKLEKDGVIYGYRPLINHDKIHVPFVEAIIELRVTPRKDTGFEEIARKVSAFDEVDSVYLMSGGYDLHVRVTGKDFRDIALFVAQRLALLDGVLSTATHFILTRYKAHGVILNESRTDERGNISL